MVAVPVYDDVAFYGGAHIRVAELAGEVGEMNPLKATYCLLFGLKNQRIECLGGSPGARLLRYDAPWLAVCARKAEGNV
jgi:hypothetical protein